MHRDTFAGDAWSRRFFNDDLQKEIYMVMQCKQ